MKIIIAACALALAGCSTMYPGISDGRQVVSSGAVGCPPTEIVISNGTAHSWTATCRGKVFYCASSPEVRCSPAR